MARNLCDVRILLLGAAAVFIFVQMRLFASQSEYADRLAAAVESESQCTSQMRFLIDQISMQQGKIVALEEARRRQDEECGHLRALVQDLERKGVKGLIEKEVPVAAVVVMACNRPDYLERTINSILKYQTSIASKFPLFISQDGPDQNVKNMALNYKQITYMQHLDFGPIETERPGEIIAYYKIARHYKWALDQLFNQHNFSRVIILEDDMEIAPDFFEYFEAAARLLDNDKTIMAVSSWNDNGQKQFVHDPGYTYWDDWMRLKETRKDRQFIRPEVCRTYNFGEHGSSFGQFFSQYLESIKLNDVHVDWNSKNLSYLEEDNFLNHFSNLVVKAKPVFGADVVLKAYNIDGDVRIQYNDQIEFESIARQFGIFEEWKDGIPRTAYKGVVVFRYQTPRRIFLVNQDSLRQLGIQQT
ncbi:hypothetical protein H6P81_018420 [Aristolochia fimbriata]|uniref:Alpha-1,3-mannosyl-glycoprotein 2-beta-N-acetylglucosaminyltransferase n=1 Tax=Aristolochia fimbriata TaxID=158543 RepID=A0AAV7E2I9_ARIFI|nr:hypothetical protein H6P81_018420 [Aristolochia fimbriata]